MEADLQHLIDRAKSFPHGPRGMIAGREMLTGADVELVHRLGDALATALLSPPAAAEAGLAERIVDMLIDGHEREARPRLVAAVRALLSASRPAAWTEVTDDPATWPPLGTDDILVEHDDSECGRRAVHMGKEYAEDVAAGHCRGCSWHPWPTRGGDGRTV